MNMTPSTAEDNRRKAAREPIRDTLFIQTVRADQITSFEGLKSANTVDASAFGLQVVLDVELLEGSEVALWITTKQSRVMVTGSVRWTRPNQNDQFLVGIELDPEAVPDMKAWIAQKQSP